jgi:hypothetical protein
MQTGLVQPDDHRRSTDPSGNTFRGRQPQFGRQQTAAYLDVDDGLARWSVHFGRKGSQYTLPYAHADFHAAAISTASGKRIFFGNAGGIFYSDDSGKSWIDNANQGLVTALIYSLSVGPVHPDNTLLGLQDNGTLFRVSKTTYTGSIGGDGFGTGWSQANDDISMGSLYFLDIRRWKSNPPNNQAKYDRLLNTNLAGDPNDGFPWYYDSYFITPIATPTPTADLTGTCSSRTRSTTC